MIYYFYFKFVSLNINSQSVKSYGHVQTSDLIVTVRIDKTKQNLKDNKMEKITIGESIDFAQILQAISRFISNIQVVISRIRLFQKLKHSTNMINYFSIDQQFLHSCICYCVAHQLRELISNTQEHQLTNYANKIRDKYFQMSVKGLWKKDFQFQQGIVCLTKIISQFYNQAFSNINIDSKLQSQIFIILIHTTIGVKVCVGSFPMLQKKYIKNEKQNKIEKIEVLKPRLTLKLNKTSSRQSVSTLSCKKNNQTAFSFSNNSSIHYSSQKECLDEFRSTLKQTLFINPLPTIKRQKKQLNSLTMYNCQREGNNIDNLRINKDVTEYYTGKKQNKPFLSTQISQSLNSQILKRKVSIAEHNKPFKIKHRMPFHSSHLVILKNGINKDETNDSQSKLPKQKLEKKKLDSKLWQQTIQGLKQKILLQTDNQRTIRKLQAENRIKQRKNRTQFCKNMQQQNYSQLDNQCVQQIQMNSQQLENILSVRQKENNRNLNIKKQPQVSNNLSGVNIYTNTILLDTSVNLKSSLAQHQKSASRRSSIQRDRQKKYLQLQNQSSTIRLDQGVKDFKDCIPTQNFNYFQKSKKMFDCKMLKSNMKMFNQEAKQRKYKMQYTMFMLPSMRTKMNFMI